MLLKMSNEYMWGCELSSANPEYEWSADFCDHNRSLSFSLLLKHAVLVPESDSNETHIVELETVGIDQNTIRQPLVVLKAGVMQQASIDMLINHIGSRFILTKGNGPVYFWGQQIVELDDLASGSPVEDLDLDKEVELSDDIKTLIDEELDLSLDENSRRNEDEDEDNCEISKTADKETEETTDNNSAKAVKRKPGPKRLRSRGRISN
ncbi:hypothetical protein CHUAL_010031 [Chamberlinius hualienensis]